MKTGKVEEAVLKRSVFRQIRYKRDEILVGAGIGEDCAAIELSEGEVFVMSTDPISLCNLLHCFLICLINIYVD